MKRNGRSFWFASLFLPKQIAADAGVLYQFCRTVDDLADRPSAESPVWLEQILSDIRSGQSRDPILTELLRLNAQHGLNLGAAEKLVSAMVRDAAGGTRIRDEADLIRYCYAVAGTVGLMMSAILGVHTPQARLQAIDLGIAMQLTNIARDVLEDAAMGRRYLPGTWVEQLSPEQIVSGATQPEETRAMLVSAVQRTLELADIFYGNAAKGLPAIPVSARSGIHVAAAVYRQIGVQLQRHGCDPYRKRVVVSATEKARIAATVYLRRSCLETLPAMELMAQHHLPLTGMPGIG